jgi:transposase
MYVSSEQPAADGAGEGPRSGQGPSPRPSRRRFTAEYKARIVAEYEQAPNGEKGAILRREGLYSSHVIEWAKARDAGALAGLGDARRSEKRPKRSAAEIEGEKLRARNAKLEDELATTKTALDIMGKAHALLEQLSESADRGPDPTGQQSSSPAPNRAQRREDNRRSHRKKS